MNDPRRRRRSEPSPRPLLSPTDRDLDALALIGRARYVTTEQVARAVYGSIDYSRKRLRRLYDAGFTRVSLRESRESSIHRLAPAGLRLLKRRRPECAEALRLPGAIDVATLDHHLLLVDARLYAAALAEARGGRLVRWVNANSALGASLGLEELRLRPDALAEVAAGGGSVIVAVEADTGLEGLAVIASKAVRYAELAEGGEVDALWFVVSAGERRQAAMAALAAEAGLGEWVRVISAEHLVARPVRELPARTVAAAGGRPSAVISTADLRKP